jgi:signal transduction histidine kinase
MGTHMLPGRERWRALRRSIRFTTAAILAIPILAAVVMWVFAGATLSSALANDSSAGVHGTALTRVAVAEAIGLAAIFIAAAGLAWFAWRLSRDAAGLETSARKFADQQLPELVERLRRGDAVGPDGEAAVAAGLKVTEFSRVGDALASVQRTALDAAATETSLRSGISQVFVSLARRSQSLLQRQLRLLDDLERKAADPRALADLFPLDHLTTRMRRHAEGLIILSGAVPGRAWSNPVPVIDVIRGAIAEVEDYKRIGVVTTSEDMVAGSAVADMIHLLAELIENAALFSPSGTRVEVRADRVGNGFAFEIEDRGLGIKPDELDAINLRLGSPADFDLANADQLGLFVVGKLAARHGVGVYLRPSPYGGTTAIVLMPISMIALAGESAGDAGPADARPDARHDEGLQLTLTGRPQRQPPQAESDAPRAPGLPGALPVRHSIFAGQPDTDIFARQPDTDIFAGPPDTDIFARQPGTDIFAGPPDTDAFGSLPAAERGAQRDTGHSQARGRPGDSSESVFTPRRPASPGEPVFPGLAGSGQAQQYPAGLAGSGRDRPGAEPEPPARPGPAGPPSPPGPPGPGVSAGTHRGLPRRVRQANLSPHLRNSPSGRPAASPREPEVRSPEQAQSLLASLQRGWERGREAELPDPGTTANGRDARDSAPGATQEET